MSISVASPAKLSAEVKSITPFKYTERFNKQLLTKSHLWQSFKCRLTALTFFQ